MVVVGQPGSGIASSALVEGRVATVTGIVRRPYPNASDRRFAITPRSPEDVTVAGKAGGDRRFELRRRAGDPWPGRRRATAAPAIDADDADLGDLAAFVGRNVRVGGLVVDLRADGFTLDDGTATGRVDPSGRGARQPRPDRTGRRPQRHRPGRDRPRRARWSSSMTRAGCSWRAIRSPTPRPMPQLRQGPSPAPPPGSSGTGGAGRLAGLGGGGLPVDAGTAGLGGLAAISAASVVVTLLRREQSRRRLASRIAARLATLGGHIGGPDDGPPAERGPSTIHSA